MERTRLKDCAADTAAASAALVLASAACLAAASALSSADAAAAAACADGQVRARALSSQRLPQIDTDPGYFIMPAHSAVPSNSSVVSGFECPKAVSAHMAQLQAEVAFRHLSEHKVSAQSYKAGSGRARTCEERHADAAAFDVASTALPSLMQSLVSATAAATASALIRAACAKACASKQAR